MKAALRVTVPNDPASLSIFWGSGLAKGAGRTLPRFLPSKTFTAVILFQHLEPWGIIARLHHSQSQHLMLKTVLKGNINSLIFKVPWMHNIYT